MFSKVHCMRAYSLVFHCFLSITHDLLDIFQWHDLGRKRTCHKIHQQEVNNTKWALKPTTYTEQTVIYIVSLQLVSWAFLQQKFHVHLCITLNTNNVNYVQTGITVPCVADWGPRSLVSVPPPPSPRSEWTRSCRPSAEGSPAGCPCWPAIPPETSSSSAATWPSWDREQQQGMCDNRDLVLIRTWLCFWLTLSFHLWVAAWQCLSLSWVAQKSAYIYSGQVIRLCI